MRNPAGIIRNAIREDATHFLVPASVVAFSAAAVSLWEFATIGGSTLALSPASIAGAILMVCGLPLPLVAVLTLKRSYSSTLVIREDHQLVTHGIYRYVRHPVYTGTLMVLLGMPLVLSSLYGLMVMAILILLFLGRIRLEERLLTEEFGDAYKAYMGRTKKLVPFLF